MKNILKRILNLSFEGVNCCVISIALRIPIEILWKLKRFGISNVSL